MSYLKKISSLALFCLVALSYSHAQPGTSVDLKKPQEYENRQLRSEKTSDKKISAPKRIMQNTFTHYNYYFNANNKLNQVIARAKASHQEDYTKLLPFYNYTLESTAQQKNDIDSVIYKCTAGILLHDLRNDWIDNMYLLLGKAYMFRKDFDSATQTFQYINYSYAPKDGGYDVPIGSNSSNTNGIFTIATKETKNVLKKVVTHPPSRNESFIWQARNFVEQGELSDAAGLIEILRADPNFPKRLKTELHEVIAYWFYNQNAYDSAAYHLTKALDEAAGRQEKARWEYLIAQLYAMAGKNDLAVKYYSKAIAHTVDPVMEIYARLNSLRINNSGKKDSYIQDNVDDLVKMAKKDKYENYKDIIYYTAAKVEMERNNTAGAIKWLQKSIAAGNGNPKQKAESFLMLADLSYDTKAYVAASGYYDSTMLDDLKLETDKARVTARRPALKTISNNVAAINEQDSLRRIANMPAAEREALIRKMVRQLRKAKGLKDEPSGGSGSTGTGGTDIFASGTKGDWYFSNPSLKAKGYSEFKATWGNRPNVDNWRRQQAVDKGNISKPGTAVNPTTGVDKDSTAEITYESLLAKLPLTPEKLEASNKIIHDALFSNGKTFLESLEDNNAAIESFEEILRRFPNPPQKEEVLFSLFYLYTKTNNKAKADAVKQQLMQEFPNGKFTNTLKEAPVSAPGTAPVKKTDAATKKYEDIYNLFISGRFEEAKEEKRKADELYGKSYWTPQLLFIESIYYIKVKEDSAAINRLNAIISNFSTSPLADKARTMIDVLKRRTEIENYLANLDVVRKDDEKIDRVDTKDQQIVSKPPEPKQDVTNKPVAIEKSNPIRIDSLASKPVVVSSSAAGFKFAPGEQHFAVLILENVDRMYVTEVKNAFDRYNLEKFYSQVIRINVQPIDGKYTLVLLGPFKDAGAAVDYTDKTRPQAASRILPWLDAAKYSFLIINNANLELLKENKDLPAYKKLITETLPGKF
jgi:tetratricopeptide (TPR) repeat protein